MKRSNVKMTVLTGVAVALLVSCGKKSFMPPFAQQSGSYKTLITQVSDMTLKREFTATLEGEQAVEIRPQVSGTITKVCVDEGEKVSKGQVLFVIDQAPYKAALQEAQSQVNSAKASLANMQLTLESKEQLHKERVVSDYDLRQARNNVSQAQATLQNAEAMLATAKTNLSYTEVKSPTSGIISMINYRTGALVSANDANPLTTVSNNSSMRAYFSVSEGYLQELIGQYGSVDAALKEMNHVGLKLASGVNYGSEGHVDAISGNVDTGTGAVTFRAKFANPDGVLRHGSQGTVSIPYTISGKVVIPQEATYELQDKIFVYRVVDNKAKSQEIKVLDLNDGTHYVVLSGLKAGQEIIAEGAGLVREGSQVKSTNKGE